MGTPLQSGRGESRGRPPRSAWVLRGLLAVGAPLFLLCALEGTLRTVGFGRPAGIFIPDTAPGIFRTNPDFTAPYFPPQFDITPLNFRIARHKEAGHLRIFVLGESAVRGTPDPGFGFTSLLGAQLAAAYPSRRFEVYNLGIVAINSHVVARIAREVAAFDPDLFVVYLGNNEVVGPFGPGSANLSVMPPLWLIRASTWVGETRTGQLIRRLAATLGRHPVAAQEWHGMSTFTRDTVRGDDPRLRTVYRNYEANLRDIMEVARDAGVHAVVATVVANLRDSPPFASLHRRSLTPQDLAAWESAYGEAKGFWETDATTSALAAVERALDIDPEYAEAHYLHGLLLERTGDPDRARSAFLEALHWDALRFRPDAPINAIARRVCAESAGVAILVDSARELGADAASTVPPCGHDTLLEHVHFTWEGNVRMGRMLAEACSAVLFGPGFPQAPWLDSDGCARAVGYTPVGRLGMLTQMEAIRGKPPFTGQLTFGDDQVRQGREIVLAQDEAASPATLAAARLQLQAARAHAPEDPNIALHLSELESRAGDPARALALLDAVLRLEPPTAELMERRSRELVALGRFTEGRDAAVEALGIDPYDLPCYSVLVDALRRTGDFQLGQSLLLKALERDPSSGLVRLGYADLLFFHGDRDAAIHECQDVLARDPGDPDALRRLVSLYSGEGQNDAAFALMVRARTTQPLNFENNVALARRYEEKGDEAEAVACLEAAERSGPANEQIHLFLARYWDVHGRPDEARVERARARRVAGILAGR